MELVSTMEISGEEREIADAYARGQIATNAQNIAENAEGIAGLNSNLSQLELSDVAGGKNLFKYNEVSGTLSKYVKCSLDAGTYTISALVNSSDTDAQTSLIVFSYEDGSEYYCQMPRDVRTSQTITLSKHVISLLFYASKDWATSTGDTFTYSDIQIEKGSTATPYEPYIPSVAMLADDVKAQNESLENQGLLNKFDGELLQGAYVSSNGSYSSTITTAVCTKNKIDVVSGDKVSARCSNALVVNTNFRWYDADGTFISGSDVTKGSSVVVPANATKCSINFATASTAITPSTVGNISVYKNNQIDSLKNDLDKYKPKEYYGKSLTMPTDGSYLVTASAMGYRVMVCTYAVYVLDGAIRYIEQVASKDLTLSFSGNVITPSYTANNIYFYVLQIGNIWS